MTTPTSQALTAEAFIEMAKNSGITFSGQRAFSSQLSAAELQELAKFTMTADQNAMFSKKLTEEEGALAKSSMDTFAFAGFNAEAMKEVLAMLGKENLRNDLIKLCSVALTRGFNIDNIIRRTVRSGQQELSDLKARYHILATSGGDPKAVTLPRILACSSLLYFDIALHNLHHFKATFAVEGIHLPFYLNNFIILSVGSNFGGIFEEICIQIQTDVSKKLQMAVKANSRARNIQLQPAEATRQFQMNAKTADKTSAADKIRFLVSFNCLTEFTKDSAMCQYLPDTREVLGDPNLACYLKTYGGKMLVIRLTFQNRIYLATGHVFQAAALIGLNAYLGSYIGTHGLFYDRESHSFTAVEEENSIADENMDSDNEDEQGHQDASMNSLEAAQIRLQKDPAYQTFAYPPEIPASVPVEESASGASIFTSSGNPVEPPKKKKGIIQSAISKMTGHGSGLPSPSIVKLNAEEEKMGLTQNQKDHVNKQTSRYDAEKLIARYKRDNYRKTLTPEQLAEYLKTMPRK